MRPGAKEGIERFIEGDVLLHDGRVLGLPVDAFMLLLTAVLLVSLGVALSLRRRKLGERSRAATAAEAYVMFIRDTMVYPNFGGAEPGRRFVPFFCSLFLFIFAMNLLGLVPGLSAATGSLSVTVGLALLFCVGSVVACARVNGLRKTVGAFVPPGLPAPIRPFLFLMELIGHIARTFALAVRIFANILAGHIVIYWILGLVVMMGAAAFPAVLLASGLYAFEMFIAFLQAFIFTLLTGIFMGQIVHPQH